MEQKAKRIGKFNVIDIIAVVLILAVVAFAGYKLMNRGGGDTQVEKVKVTYQVKAEGVPAELYENTKKHLPSKMMASGAYVGGEIVDVEKEPYYVLGNDGQWVEDPYHVNLIFTAETEVAGGGIMLSKVGEQEIRVGKQHIIKSEFVEVMDTIIIDVQWGE
ncbi:MAG: DUF4330 domain-containing protein [Oscillibacter sp.]|nr:DUF4330 domain-containing protein [Oscillibacter sp.]